MSRLTEAQLGSNVPAFLDCIAFSEQGPLLDIPETDDGYRTIVGSTPRHLILMDNYSTHPNRLIEIRAGLKSTAAGRYQLLSKWYLHYRDLLHLKDFSPESQDLIAVQQIRECGALQLVQSDRFAEAIERVRRIWASLPGAGYGQHENTLSHLQTAYESAKAA